jgi:hypothetical protein
MGNCPTLLGIALNAQKSSDHQYSYLPAARTKLLQDSALRNHHHPNTAVGHKFHRSQKAHEGNR